MADQRTVIVTGYGAWAKTAENPAAMVLRALADLRWSACRFVPIEVPVRTSGLTEIVEDALLTHRPDIWLGLGVAPETTAIHGEIVGINCRDFDVPDNDGVTLEGAPVIEDGEDAYFATLPVRGIVAAVKDAGIPAAVSYSAGTHLCNQMLYTSLHLIRRHDLQTRCGFMHVPYTPEFAVGLADAEKVRPSMALPLMVEAARIAVEVSLEALGAEAGEDVGAVSVAGE